MEEHESTPMRKFYETIGLEGEIDYVVNSDGIYEDCVLFEHKKINENTSSVLMQMIKYASKLRIMGKRIPEKLILVDLENHEVLIFNSIDFLDKIEKVYIGPSSKNNGGIVVTADMYKKIDYGPFDGKKELFDVIDKAKRDKNYTRYHVDFTNILQLSKEFYKHINSKDAFINGEDCEIRKPDILSDRILPYEKESNTEFNRIMDCLNTKEQQKSNGAFYTPDLYATLSQKMLLDRIEEINKVGLDYIVVDRCAGTGALYRGLSDEVLSHCILSTLEINEYLLLQEEFLNKATIVVPPTDALSYDIIPTETDGDGNIISDFIREKIQDPNCAIILYENPPFAEAGSRNKDGEKDVKMHWKNSFVMTEMKKELDENKNQKYKGAVLNDLSNLFIWSAFKYYLTKKFDSYIVYSPVKYWKTQNLVNKKEIDSFICNRKHFHANSEGAIICSHWSNNDSNKEYFTSKVYDIHDDSNKIGHLKFEGYTDIRKAKTLMSKAYDKRKFDDDKQSSIYVGYNGLENIKNKQSVNVLINDESIAYLKFESFSVKGEAVSITTLPLYNGHGFVLRKDNYLNYLPLFCAASAYDIFKWYEKELINKTYDGNGSYLNDNEFIKKCFIYTCLSFKNKCRSLNGSDGRYYRNELCFDEGTLASKDLDIFRNTIGLTDEEKNLIEVYEIIISQIKPYDEYIEKFSYGTYQIDEEINIQIDKGKKKKDGTPKLEFKWADLNGNLKTLKDMLKNYYVKNIYQDLYKYELLK